MSAYIVSLDAGTTSARAMLFDRNGQMIDAVQQEIPQVYPRPGWVEHQPGELWSVQRRVARELLQKQKLQAGDIAALGIANQRETTLLWDRASGRPIHNAIVWQDRRTAQICEQLKADGFESLIRQRTGLLLDAYFSGTKIRWLLDEIPGARRKAEKGELAFGTVDSWLLWHLTHGRVHATDVSNASRTLLFNIHKLAWDEELLDLLDIPAAILPQVRSSSEVYGSTAPEHFGGEIPIAGIAGDQQAATFGQMCIETGLVKNTYGTGCFLMMNTGTRIINSRHKLLSTVAWQIGNEVQYALEGSIFIGGAIVQWIRDNLQFISEARDIEALASSVEDHGGVYFVPGFVGLGAPHWDPYSTGLLIGLNRDTRPGHIARAALEAICLQSVDVLQTMEKDSGLKIKELRVDGGAAVNDLLMQTQADLSGYKLLRPNITETTALGAAYLAGLAVGYWQDLDELRTHWTVEQTFRPALSADEAGRRLDQWHWAVERSKGWGQPDG
jgi:glycerol kinase